MLLSFLYAVWFLVLIPLFDGILKSVKAVLNGRRPTRLLQVYYDLYKLFRKETFYSQQTSYISIIAPAVMLAVSCVFLVLVPTSVMVFDVHVIYLFYISAIGSFFMMIYAMDNATYFAGLGVEREMFVLAIIEPVLMLFIATNAFISNAVTVSDLTWVVDYTTLMGVCVAAIMAIVLFYIMLAENKRFPFDNPATHLELTMIHEAMLLETSGIQLGMIELSSKIKLFAFIALFVSIFLPFTFGVAGIALFGVWVIKMLVCVVFFGLFEVLTTKIRLFRYQEIFALLLVVQIITLMFFILR